MLKKNEILELECQLDNISYSCGSCFQDIEDYQGGIFEHVYVNDKLTCDSPIEFRTMLCFEMLCVSIVVVNVISHQLRKPTPCVLNAG